MDSFELQYISTVANEGLSKQKKKKKKKKKKEETEWQTGKQCRS